MLCNEKLSVKEYVRLTDADINGVLMDWADNEDAVLSGYARRLVLGVIITINPYW